MDANSGTTWKEETFRQVILDCVSCEGNLMILVAGAEDPPMSKDITLVSKTCNCKNIWFDWRRLTIRRIEEHPDGNIRYI